MQKARSGFTLIELLVVIAIIGILSTLAVVALNSARQRSRDAKRVSDVRQLQTALELGFSETSTYPVVAATQSLGEDDANDNFVLCKDSAATDPAKWENITTDCTGTIYMGLVPANNSPNGATYAYTSLNTDGSACTTAPCASYRLTFNLEGATGQLASGDNCANPSGIVAGSSC